MSPPGPWLVLLGEAADPDRRARPALAGQRRQRPGDGAEQGALAGAVGADNPHPFAPEHRQRDLGQHRPAGEPDRRLAQVDHPLAAPLGAPQRQADLPPFQHRPVDVVELLDPPLGVSNPGGVTGVVRHGTPLLVAADRVLQAGDLLLTRGPHLLLAEQRQLARGRIGRVVAGPDADPPLVELGDLAHRLVEQVAVMRDHHDRAPLCPHRRLQPAPTNRVQMRLRLVQEEHVGIPDQASRQGRQLPLAARELGGRPGDVGVGQPELAEDRAGASVDGVPVQLLEAGEQPLLPAQDARHAVEIGVHLWLGQLPRAGFQLAFDLGDLGPCLQHDLERGAGIGGDELRQVGGGQVTPPHRRRRVRLLEAAQDAQEGRLAGAVGADHSDPGPVADLQVDTIQDAPGAERLRRAPQRDQGHAAESTEGLGCRRRAAPQAALSSWSARWNRRRHCSGRFRCRRSGDRCPAHRSGSPDRPCRGWCRCRPRRSGRWPASCR